ncbi:MAG TPA: hypothetical protein DIW81_28605, partial [Planctomycetaceae bacterium]|nr:hypothetical protein [Planctomycetaceae bacterium]
MGVKNRIIFETVLKVNLRLTYGLAKNGSSVGGPLRLEAGTIVLAGAFGFDPARSDALKIGLP